eukprot:4366964-Alexandrium_andersonii.AAC.1
MRACRNRAASAESAGMTLDARTQRPPCSSESPSRPPGGVGWRGSNGTGPALASAAASNAANSPSTPGSPATSPGEGGRG